MGPDFSSFYPKSSMGNFGMFNNYNPQLLQNNFMTADFSNMLMPTGCNLTSDSLFNFGGVNSFQPLGFNMMNSDLASIAAFSNSFNMFNMFMDGNMPTNMANNMFTDSFNTQNNLGALQNVYNPDLGNKLANIANKVANQTNTVGYCAAGVVDALEEANFTKSGEARAGAAYEIAPKLRKSSNFKEVSVSREDLQNLPAGCVVVWDASEGHQYGHITVTLGKDENGNPKEASDHVQGLITNRNANFTVFVPVGSNA